MIDPILERFLQGIKPLSDRIDDLYLFGSRARDDWRPDSDYDVLVVVAGKDRALKSGLYDSVMDTLLDTGRLVSLKIYDRAEFNRLCSIPTPFMENIMKEGKRIGPVH